VPRQELTGADRTWAERYKVGDVLRYARASKETGIGKGEYAQVKSIDAPNNRLTVERQDGTERTYDPRRQRGVSVFREEMRSFSVGDRIQFTAPANDLKLVNRELGTIKSIGQDGRLSLKMDAGRAVDLDPREHPHLDHGYAMTSHSSQGQTADRVLIHVDTELGAKDLLNSRMAMSPSREERTMHSFSPTTARSCLRRSVTMYRSRARMCPRSNQPDYCGAAGSLPGSTAGPRHRSRNRFLEPCLPDNGSVARRKPCQGRPEGRRAGMHLDSIGPAFRGQGGKNHWLPNH